MTFTTIKYSIFIDTYKWKLCKHTVSYCSLLVGNRHFRSAAHLFQIQNIRFSLQQFSNLQRRIHLLIQNNKPPLTRWLIARKYMRKTRFNEKFSFKQNNKQATRCNLPHILILIGAEGFEPSNGGVRVHCLTTWRRPSLFCVRHLTTS